MVQRLSWAPLAAVVLTIAGLHEVSAKVCYLSQEPDPSHNWRLRWLIQGTQENCICTSIRVGGVNLRFQQQQSYKPYLTDNPLFTTDVEKIRDYFGCNYPADCQEWLDAGYNTNDVYTIYPMQYQNGLQIYCDMKKNESRWMGLQGGWIVFQRRQDGSVNFTRSWAEYRDGFGNLTGEFWLGNEYIRQLTGEGRWELLVELLVRKATTSLARYLMWYRTFNITGEQYTLHVGGYDTTLHLTVCDVAQCRSGGDSLTTKHNNQDFSTYDRDNDNDAGNNCAEKYSGGWWFNKCHSVSAWNPDVTSNLNGEYSTARGGSANPSFLRWKGVGPSETIYTSEMKMRKV
ncbi:ficolin-1-like [Acanthaster planci]|uniref:Ficolin-1-like n=1 Tax=Acanthaster planci TaxID=133434 RepID=A0A8B7ZPM2_ACAPL|nr:ficolin-1-like [Acanthaster planci]